ncbi:YqzL family protein [Pelosinus sp. UFO1]
MWEVFQSTGHIGAYLMYRSCTESKDQLETPPDSNVGL